MALGPTTCVFGAGIPTFPTQTQFLVRKNLVIIKHVLLLFLIPQVVKKPGVKNKVKKLKSNRWSAIRCKV